MKNSANAGSSSHHRWLALIIVLMAPFMATVDFYIIFVASPSIQHGLQASPEQIQFAIAGYTIAYGVNLITAGRLGDTYGRKRMFVIGMISFIITSALCAFAQDPLTLIITRVFQGTAVSTSTLYNSSYLHIKTKKYCSGFIRYCSWYCCDWRTNPWWLSSPSKFI
ncbi:MAG: MFS transporter [Candidatus Nitrosopolaris sp.]